MQVSVAQEKQFCNLLGLVDLGAFVPDTHSTRYLQYLIENKSYYISVYAGVINEMLRLSAKPISKLRVCDYGAGNGLLGLFAKFCGAQFVLINDMAEEFILAAENLARELNIKVDAFCAGDVDSIKKFELDAVVGTDVIEHIYNLDKFFSVLKDANPQMIFVFTTASNTANILKARQLRAMQFQDENEGKPFTPGAVFSDSHPSYRSMRQRFIEKNFPEFTHQQIDDFATKTRGLTYSDIADYVNRYLSEGQWAYSPPLGTNTCHPETGSWTERLLTIEEYRKILFRHCFSLEVKKGKRNTYCAGAKRVVNAAINVVIGFTGNFLAPYIVLSGKGV